MGVSLGNPETFDHNHVYIGMAIAGFLGSFFANFFSVGRRK